MVQRLVRGAAVAILVLADEQPIAVAAEQTLVRLLDDGLYSRQGLVVLVEGELMVRQGKLWI